LKAKPSYRTHMPKDDDILLEHSAKLVDSDGDGVSDVQERLDGTDPGDASDSIRQADLKPDLGDIRGDLDRVTLEREVAFDPTANMPEGMSIDSGLKGLTNLDGTDLKSGVNHFGIGEDSILVGHLGENSPLGMERDPLTPGPKLGSANDDGWQGDPPPEGTDLNYRAPNNDLVGLGEGGPISSLAADIAGKFGRDVNEAIKMAKDYAHVPEAMYERFMQEVTKPSVTPAPPKGSIDPDADPGYVGTIGTGSIPVDIDGPRVVEGYGTLHIEGDEPPPKDIDLVTDGGDGSVDTIDGSGTPRGAPDAPVIHTINPDLGVVKPPVSSPPPSGGGGIYDLGLVGTSNAASAATSSDAGATAVNRFATEYLADDSLEAPSHDLAGAGLGADLGADLAPQHEDFQSAVQEDPGATPPDGFAGLDGDDPFDP
jgi:hypothetical protein